MNNMPLPRESITFKFGREGEEGAEMKYYPSAFALHSREK